MLSNFAVGRRGASLNLWRLSRLDFAVAVLSGLACLPTGAFASDYSDQVIADGAIHYWRFEEGATSQPALDQISGIAGQTNNPGVYAGNVTLGQPSAGPGLGNAARLGGENGTHVALGTPQHPGDSISVEAWVSLDVDATASFSPVIARWDGSYELDVNATQADRVDFVLRNNSNAFAGPAGPAPLARGQWHHVVGTYDAATGNGLVYLDGVAGAPVALGGPLGNAGGDDALWYIGRTRGPESGFAWKGLIDEVAIYPRALTADEISNHIRLASVPEPSSAVLLGLGLLAIVRRRLE